ncbi:hypothetical protein MKW98_005856 [Papaver atlanticum]|uniref:Pectinesterase inhibitor domain-containing protein n=1 Tax=Papaver atlanticum TaxID=357466 RepID=A0AAD4TF25_9MAGN|nr:hypothetical protein MKW98_005856 [Papaver atlanticum]
MDLCLKNANYISVYIDIILKDGKEEPRATQYLNEYVEFYSNALEQIRGAMKAFSDKVYNTALVHMNRALRYADTCKTRFTEAGVDFSPLRNQDSDS